MPGEPRPLCGTLVTHVPSLLQLHARSPQPGVGLPTAALWAYLGQVDSGHCLSEVPSSLKASRRDASVAAEHSGFSQASHVHKDIFPVVFLKSELQGGKKVCDS